MNIAIVSGSARPQMQLTPKVKEVFVDGKLLDEKWGQSLDKFLEKFLWLGNAITTARNTTT